MKFIFLILLFLNAVSAQTTDYVNAVIVPGIVLLVFAYGLISFFKLPKIASLVLSVVLIGVAYVSGIINEFASMALSFGGLASTGLYIGLFLVGATLASRSAGGRPKKSVKYADARKMSRKQISQEMNSIEKRIVQLQSKLESVKIQEHNLELKFSTSKSPEVAKELERIRKIKNELSDAMDMMVERKEYYKKAYREATA
ncbi:MAG: hypothetical protein QXF12_03020 [Candidatus Aenigmatarchaeota archaeon]